jgi:hypothetical protein
MGWHGTWNRRDRCRTSNSDREIIVEWDTEGNMEMEEAATEWKHHLVVEKTGMEE